MLSASDVCGQSGSDLAKEELVVLSLCLKRCLLGETCDREQRRGQTRRQSSLPSEVRAAQRSG